MWSWSRGGMGGVGHLPEAGGSLAQASVNLAALAYCNQIAAEVERPARDRDAGRER